MYTIEGHGKMIADQVRVESYAQALRQAVRPGSVIADLGTGTGIFALLACKYGARRVYAIEPDHVIQVAREIAAANGYADRIEFLQMFSTQVTLPEQADVIVSDLRGALPFFHNHLPVIVDARTRLLAPGGILIPQRDTLWAAVVEAPKSYTRLTASFDGNCHGLNMRPARWRTTNTFYKAELAPEQLLAEPKCWATLDYTTLEETNACADLTWSIARAGTAHGLGIWFDTALVEGVGFSNAPGGPATIYGHTFVPWPEPVCLAEGDTVSVTLHADLIGEDYIWRWNTCVLDLGRPGQLKADFKQSTLFASPLSAEQLRKVAASHVPARNEDGEIDHFILTQMDGHTPLGEIARRLVEQFPSRFAGWRDALTQVGKLSHRYSR